MLQTVQKNIVLGAVAGGAVGGLIISALGALVVSGQSGEMMVAFAFGGAALSAPFGAIIGGLAGGLAGRWPTGRVRALGAGLGGALGAFLALSLVSMTWGNRVMAAMALVFLPAWGFAVAAAVARWLAPRPGPVS